MLFAGDPHGDFSPVLRACLARAAGTLVLVGDLDCPRPLRAIFAPAIAAGWDIRWILGNHDCETEAAFDNLAGDCPEGDLGYRVAEIEGLRVAGLPGTFKPAAWLPDELPRYRNAADFLAAQPKARWFRGGMPLWHRDTIFPDDVDRLSGQSFDILVTHEAPSSHRHGFAAIDRLAEAGGARLIVHGHHHVSYRATLAGGIAVRGLGLADVWDRDRPDGV